MNTIERRYSSAAAVSATATTLAGLVRYGVESTPLAVGGKRFVEVIAPGAFKRSLAARHQVILTAGHKSDDPLNCIGRWPSGGLVLTDAAAGLDWSCSLPDTTASRDLHRLVKTGVIKGASFEFIVDADGEKWSKRADGVAARTITAARLLEINPCASPAYEQNTIEARNRRPGPASVIMQDIRVTEMLFMAGAPL